MLTQLNRGPRLAALDGIRGLAALVVLLQHLLMSSQTFGAYFWARYQAAAGFAEDPLVWLLFNPPLRLAWSGREAVIVFFVLSGFVLSLPWINARRPTYIEFVARRICRIYLPYIAAAALAMALLTIAPHHPLDAAAIADDLLMLGGPAHNFVNAPSWSLIHEMRISLVFPLLVLPLVNWGAKGAALTILALLAVVLALPPSPAWLLSMNDTAWFAVFFVLGIATAQHAAAIRTALARSAAARGACLFGGLLLLMPLSYDFYAGFLTALGACLVIYAALAPGRFERLLLARIPQWLGQVSYSLYLVHVPVLLTIWYLGRDTLPLTAIVAIAAPAAFLTAWGFHQLVERPATRLGRRLGQRFARPRRAVAMPFVSGSQM